MPQALQADHLSFRYTNGQSGKFAVDNVSLTVEEGERLLLLGPNGAGKSTLLKMFAGLLRPTDGGVTIWGRSPIQSRGQMGVVGNATYLYEELTVAENLRLYAELFGVTDTRRVGFVLDMLQLREYAHERVGSLSRGQQQRVALARAILHDPPILFLDEPDTGLDAASAALLQEVLLTPGRTVVLTTHNLEVGAAWGTRSALLARGRVERLDSSLNSARVPELALHLRALARSSVVPA